MMTVQALALTFDDGPDGRYTPALLDLLARGGRPGDVLSDRPARGRASGLDRAHAGRRPHRRPALRRARAPLRPGRGVVPARHRARARPPARARRRGRRCGARRGETRRRGRRGRRRARACDWSAGPSTPTTGAATPPRPCSPPRATSLTAGAIVLAHDGIGPGARRLDAEADPGLRRAGDRATRADHGLALRPLIMTDRCSHRDQPTARRSTRRSSRSPPRRRSSTPPRIPPFPEDGHRPPGAGRRAGLQRRRPGRSGRRPPRSSSWSAGWRAPMARSGGSSTGTSTRSSGSPSRGRPGCASASSQAVPPAGCAAGVWGGDPVPGEGTAGHGARDRGAAQRSARRQDLLLGRRRAAPRAGARPRRARRPAAARCGST